MSYINNGERREKAAEELECAIDAAVSSTPNFRKQLFEAIQEYVQASIKYAVDDLRNEIKKTGDWSRDY